MKTRLALQVFLGVTTGSVGCFQNSPNNDSEGSGTDGTDPTTAGTDPTGPTSTGTTSGGPGTTGTAGGTAGTAGGTAGGATATDGTGGTTATDATGGATATAGTAGTTGVQPECDNGTAEPGELCLGPYTDFDTVNPVADFAVGDRDGNLTLDIVTADPDDAESQGYFGSGAGTFVLGSSEAFGLEPTAVELGFVNNNADLDVVYGHANDGLVGVALNDGAGTIPASFPTYTADGPDAVAVGDLNNDGFDDVVTVGDQANRINIFLSTQSGTLGAATNLGLTGGNVEQDILLAELNNNSSLDLILLRSSPVGRVEARLGNGSGGFGTTIPANVGAGPVAMVTGDFDNDGIADLATANTGNNDVTVLVGMGNGGFTMTATVAAGDTPSDIAAGDMDNDGSDDLVVTNRADDTVHVMISNGDGTFAGATILDVDDLQIRAPGHVEVADFNQDGALDIAVANPNSISGVNPTIGLFLSSV